MRNQDGLGLTPYGIFKALTSDETYKKNCYIIMGRPGPTGKTWLTHKLKEHGYNAVELSEFLCELLRYDDDKNHIRFDTLNNTVIIVLNKPLRDIKPKKKITIILDEDVYSVNVTTNVRDGIGELAVQSKHVLSDLEDGDGFDLRDL